MNNKNYYYSPIIYYRALVIIMSYFINSIRTGLKKKKIEQKEEECFKNLANCFSVQNKNDNSSKDDNDYINKNNHDEEIYKENVEMEDAIELFSYKDEEIIENSNYNNDNYYINNNNNGGEIYIENVETEEDAIELIYYKDEDIETYSKIDENDDYHIEENDDDGNIVSNNFVELPFSRLSGFFISGNFNYINSLKELNYSIVLKNDIHLYDNESCIMTRGSIIKLNYCFYNFIYFSSICRRIQYTKIKI